MKGKRKYLIDSEFINAQKYGGSLKGNVSAYVFFLLYMYATSSRSENDVQNFTQLPIGPIKK